MKRFIDRIDTHELALLLIGALFGMIFGMGLFAMIDDRSAANMPTPPAQHEETTEQEMIIEEYVLSFVKNDDAETEAVYSLTASEREVVESVVMAEAGGESFDGQKAVAQCILDACIKSGLRPDVAVRRFGYTASRPAPSDSVIDAVSAVFDKGEVVTAEPILYFYAPAVCSSPWHETQTYVLTIGGHKFFKEA